MGCKGSKAAEAPKSEVASSTLLPEPEEPKGEVPATQGSAPETTPKDNPAQAMADDKSRKEAVGKLFAALDKNHDSKIAASEFLEFLRTSLGSSHATLQQAEKSLAFKDKNNDGSLSEDELAGACEGADTAQVLSWAEGLEKAAALTLVKRLYLAMDRNHDNQIVASEFLAFLRVALGSSSTTLEQAEKSLAFKDKNHDGALDEAEIGLACDGMDYSTMLSMCEKLERQAAIGKLFAALDKNHDSKIAASEFLEFLRTSLGSSHATLQQAETSLAFKDKDNDGTLSEQELGGACEGADTAQVLSWAEGLEKAAVLTLVKRLYLAMDRNHDNKIVASEFLEFLRVALGSSSTTLQQAEKSFAFKDKNHDGTLDETELALACDGMDYSTMLSMCEKLEAQAASQVKVKPNPAPSMFWCCASAPATDGEVRP